MRKHPLKILSAWFFWGLISWIRYIFVMLSLLLAQAHSEFDTLCSMSARLHPAFVPVHEGCRHDSPEFRIAEKVSRTWTCREPKHRSPKSTGQRQESATFLQRSFSYVAVQFFVAAQLLVKQHPHWKKNNVAAQLLRRNFPKIAAQLLFSLVACCRGGV